MQYFCFMQTKLPDLIDLKQAPLGLLTSFLVGCFFLSPIFDTDLQEDNLIWFTLCE